MDKKCLLCGKPFIYKRKKIPWKDRELFCCIEHLLRYGRVKSKNYHYQSYFKKYE